MGEYMYESDESTYSSLVRNGKNFRLSIDRDSNLSTLSNIVSFMCSDCNIDLYNILYYYRYYTKEYDLQINKTYNETKYYKCITCHYINKRRYPNIVNEKSLKGLFKKHRVNQTRYIRRTNTEFAVRIQRELYLKNNKFL